MPGNHSMCKVHAGFFLYLEAKEAGEVIEASAVMLSCLLRFLRPLKFGYSSKTSDKFTSQIKPLIFVTD